MNNKIVPFRNNDGVIEIIDVDTIITYKTCGSCELRSDCNRAGDTDDKCIIEKELLEKFMYDLNKNYDVDVEDGALLIPLIQNLFRMRRYYHLESYEDLNEVLHDKIRLAGYKELMTNLFKSETQYIKLLKELVATRKEKQITKNKQVKRMIGDFSRLLSGTETIDVEVEDELIIN